MDHIPRLSEVLYVGLCRTLGTPTEVAIRRDVRDMVELIQKPLDTELRRMWSGSYREGFRLESSDRDIMYWSQYHKMISEISQTNIYDASKHTIILMEDTGVPPGFVRLQILTPPRDNLSTLACVSFSDKYYLSNLLWREKWLQVYKNIKAFQNVDGHGPCTTGFFAEIEFDYALCLTSTHWPKTALFWIERSLKYIWPPAYVLEEIQRNRFHCVPIGSNIPSSYNEIEWRLSFSRAEQKLVYTMNHTQFLCYGLLKLFLKEVINYRTEEPLLCSYHIKTTLFWVIQLGSIQWHPNNLLHCVWKCLKYLIHCVYHGTFSNFFIPENNMFTNKVVGDARNCLFEQLNKYYQLGVSCLLLSPSLSSILEKALRIPSYVIPFVNGHLQSAEEIDMRVACEVLPNSFEANEFNTYYLYLKSIESFLQFSFSPYQTLTQQICIAQTLVYMAFHMANNSSCCTHRDLYALDRSLCNMLKLAGKIVG
ncbi:uncharacterized protein LOC134254767 isoform X2 [Saccostrea cucullata]|uniref:uncharacterized protein LOC134254767 isoform X2 n=1 Tax=Saccostrea cuccullata TaxID=36930 RepID=UPI002ED673BA